MAVVREVQRGLGKAFQAIVRKGGFRLSRVHGTRRNAAEWAGRVEAAIAASGPDKPFERAAWLPPTGKQEFLAVLDESCPHGGWTVKRALEHYDETLAQKKKGYAVESVRIRMWQASAIAGIRLDALTLEDVQAVVNSRLTDRAGDTVRREVNVLRALYRDAFEWWKIKDLPEPCRKLKLPKPSPHRERLLQDGHGGELGEEDKLRAALAMWKRKPDVHIDLFDFSIETGLRLSESHAVRVQNLLSARGIMRVELGDSKNGDERRVVLSAKAREIAERRREGLEPDAKLFPVSESARRRAWAYARAVAKVKDLRWHDLRHEGITRMADRGLHMGEIMAQSGHRDAESVKRYMNARAKTIAKKLG